MNEPPEQAAGPRNQRPGVEGDRVVIVGARRCSRRLARYLSHGPWLELPVVGFVDAGRPREAGSPANGRQLAFHPHTDPVPVLGNIDRLAEVLDRSGATHVVVALTGQPALQLRPKLTRLIRPQVRVHWIQEGTLRLDRPTTTPATARPVPLRYPRRWDRLAKRGVDILGAAAGLCLLAPLFLVVAAAILATSGRPIFYLQERVSQGGRLFRMVKFRSMRRDAEGKTGPIWATDHDDRCTRVGAWLRQTNIDELPQLFNVLKGEMSLVGPRPERPIFVDRFGAALPDYNLRHAVPGGMTGWAQVHGWRGRTSLRKRLQYDLDYIQRWSFWLDFRILLMTIQHIGWGKTSWHGSKGGCLGALKFRLRPRRSPSP